ncbi:TRAP transporter substrate-binding protein DctP [Frigidibacter sp.]|uniref:TRAP transporter substrate-binding protein DctP n=1 Tax=Frigidibacter sp. TaxID=2586418 RepID=UPI002735E28A|nr:TRAP transporter substrate-binding protein DctP [Frigidibacter sp.]MDP3342201.1 TRAP transporter substrate-binding protein DctP [Frigidibacter sp.]
MKFKGFLGLALSATAFASAAYAEPEVLRFAVSVPAQVHYNQKVLIPWAEKVTADSQGTLVVEMYFAGALGKAGQFVDIVQSGAADIAMDITSYYPGRFQQSDVAYLPNLIGYDSVKASEALWAMYDEGAFDEDYAGLKLLAVSTPTAAMMMTTETPVTAPADAAGLRIGAGGRIKAAILDEVGAAMINLDAFNMYQPLGRGVVDGVVTHFTGIAAFRLNEVGKFYTEVPLGGSFTPVFMSQGRFDALPEAARNAIEMNSGAAMSAALGEVWREAHAEGQALATSTGGTIIVPEGEAAAAWEGALNPVVEQWVSEGEGRQVLVDQLKAHLAD